jgi:cytochrome c oxidase cbb3-type subunit 3
MTNPRDELLDHEFDGIREYDNPPPGWIMFILYVSVVFALGYWGYYHIFNQGSLPVKAYDEAVAAALEVQVAKMAGQPLTDETLLMMSKVPARADEGRQIFAQFCVACHQPDGSGNVGPNLTDNYWIHGGKPLQILNTVTNGVPEKGMVAWRDQLGPVRIQKVVSYVLTLKGKNLPGKAPQGNLETAEAAPVGGAAPAPAAGAKPAAAGTPAGSPAPATTPAATPAATPPAGTPAATTH